MRRTPRAIGLGLTLATLVVGSADAQEANVKAKAKDQAKAKAAPAPGLANLREALISLDANGDQAIDRDEVPDDGVAAFERLLKLGDANKNGRLEGDEMRALFEKVRNLGPVAPAERVKSMDKDGDGKVSRDEFLGLAAQFDRLDADKDGFVTREEFAKFAAAYAPAALLDRFQSMDKDGDGKVTAAEFDGPEPLFARLDADKDGSITRDEIGRLAPAAPPAAAAKPKDAAKGKAAAKAAQLVERVKGMDKDGDGRVTRDEFRGLPQVFDRLDRDGDGVISADELRRGPRAGALPKKKAAKKAGDGTP
jgi:Ca2+-binding EF-hand superfamily protein